jgi:hypothetical protein
MLYRKTIVGVLVAGAMLASPARATPLIATFDSFSEGSVSHIFSDGGITFSDMDSRLSSFPDLFIIENASSLSDPAFSPPNFLTTVGYVPGPGFGFGRFGSARLTFGATLAFEATMDIFSFRNPNILTLEALLGGIPVGSNSIGFQLPGTGDLHQTLSISGVAFDELRLVGSGPDEDGAVFIGIDNVNITLVPEPYTVSLFGLGFLHLFGYRWRHNRKKQQAK